MCLSLILLVMVNSGSVNGIPAHSSEQYLDFYLRKAFNFTGFVVSDWQDIEKLVFFHHVASTDSEVLNTLFSLKIYSFLTYSHYVITKAISMAVEAGIDMSMVPSVSTQYPPIGVHSFLICITQ